MDCWYLKEKIHNLYLDGKIDIFDREDWTKYANEGRITKKDIDHVIYQREYGGHRDYNFNFKFKE
jgi:hypothetical protein